MLKPCMTLTSTRLSQHLFLLLETITEPHFGASHIRQDCHFGTEKGDKDYSGKIIPRCDGVLMLADLISKNSVRPLVVMEAQGSVESLLSMY
jgi:hypothetical protein